MLYEVITIGHHQRRRSEPVETGLGMNASFEVAVPGKYRPDRQAADIDGRGDGGRQRSGVADAGGTAVTDLV